MLIFRSGPLWLKENLDWSLLILGRNQQWKTKKQWLKSKLWVTSYGWQYKVKIQDTMAVLKNTQSYHTTEMLLFPAQHDIVGPIRNSDKIKMLFKLNNTFMPLYWWTNKVLQEKYPKDCHLHKTSVHKARVQKWCLKFEQQIAERTKISPIQISKHA